MPRSHLPHPRRGPHSSPGTCSATAPPASTVPELRAGGDQARGAARPPPGTDPSLAGSREMVTPGPPSVLPGAAGLGSIRGCRVCGGSWSTSVSERKSPEGNAAVSIDSCLVRESLQEATPNGVRLEEGELIRRRSGWGNAPRRARPGWISHSPETSAGSAQGARDSFENPRPWRYRHRHRILEQGDGDS